MSSKVEICNMALQRIGASRIDSLSDGTEEAVSCNLLYDMVATEVMSAGAWRSCMARSVLARTVTTPAFQWTYEYQLPVDPKCLKVVKLWTDTTQSTLQYEIEGDKLLTNETSASIKYVSFLSSPDDYGPYLTRAIVSRLAWELAYKNTGTASMRQDLQSQFERDLILGLGEDGTQGTGTLMYIDTLLRDR